MNKNIIEFVKNNPSFWSRAGFTVDPTLVGEDGLPLLVSDAFEKFRGKHEDFMNAGVKIHTSILNCGWTDVDKYDYRVVDKTLDTILGGHPDVFYMPRVKLNVPPRWCGKYPEETFVYNGGPEIADGIAALAGTSEQDIYGVESPWGYPCADKSAKTPPSLNGKIGLQCYASEQWRKDAGVALLKLIEHIEAGPYKNQIIGYQLSYGIFGECVWWGTWNSRTMVRERMGDYGICGKKAFYNWGLKKYKTLDVLKEKWQQPELCENNISIPSPELRRGITYKLEEFFRADDKYIICCDYEEFLSDVNVDSIMYFSHLVKEHNSDLLVGSFYGYIIGIPNSSGTGHLAMDKLLSCPDVDFLAAPKGYYRNRAYEPGLEQAPMQSVGLKKLWLDECDNRTHMDKAAHHNPAQNMDETRTCMWREYAKNLSHNQGFWWMDLGTIWYDDDEIMQEVEKVTALNKVLRQKDGTDAMAEVLLVVDDKSMRHSNLSFGINEGFVQEFATNAKMCGVATDLYRLADLKDLDLSRYKAAVFLDTFWITEEERNLINNGFSKDTMFIWNYAPGIISDKYSVDNVKALTGFSIKQYDNPDVVKEQYGDKINVDFPPCYISNECTPLLSYQDGNTMVGKLEHGGRTNVLSMLPFLSAEQLCELYKEAGCVMTAPCNCAVYGDNRFVFVNAGTDVDGKLILPKTMNVKEEISQRTYENVSEIELKLERGKCAFFRFL